jgi:hypothetical protein
VDGGVPVCGDSVRFGSLVRISFSSNPTITAYKISLPWETRKPLPISKSRKNITLPVNRNTNIKVKFNHFPTRENG